MNTSLAINLIATNPQVRSGRPYLVGTTLTVADIAIAHMFWMMALLPLFPPNMV